MVIEALETQEQEEIETIHSDNWELPVCNLGSGKYTWRPKTAYLPYFIFYGPQMTRRSHGINLEKDLLIGVHGPRGSCKTITLSYMLAKKMRLGQPVWNNWPISFYVIEPTCWDLCDRHDLCSTCTTGHKTYYESSPLNMDKLYTFNSEISNGSVGLTELQYYAEARTSGRGQNRFLSYQLMQLRKSALSFFYDVQNPRWADNRFSWSDDVKIFCRDVAKMNYDLASVGHELEEGEFSHWMIQDMSGVLTGVQYEDSGIEYGPFQFEARYFWKIYPTQWKIDVYEAVYSMKQKSEKADKEAALGKAMEFAILSFLDEGKKVVVADELWARAAILGNVTMPPTVGGKIVGAYNIPKHQVTKGKDKGKYEYDLSVFIQENDGNN